MERGENAKITKEFLPEKLQKEGPPKDLQGYLRSVRKRIVIGGPSPRKRPPLPRLLQ